MQRKKIQRVATSDAKKGKNRAMVKKGSNDVNGTSEDDKDNADIESCVEGLVRLASKESASSKKDKTYTDSRDITRDGNAPNIMVNRLSPEKNKLPSVEKLDESSQVKIPMGLIDSMTQPNMLSHFDDQVYSTIKNQEEPTFLQGIATQLKQKHSMTDDKTFVGGLFQRNRVPTTIKDNSSAYLIDTSNENTFDNTVPS